MEKILPRMGCSVKEAKIVWVMIAEVNHHPSIGIHRSSWMVSEVGSSTLTNGWCIVPMKHYLGCSDTSGADAADG